MIPSFNFESLYEEAKLARSSGMRKEALSKYEVVIAKIRDELDFAPVVKDLFCQVARELIEILVEEKQYDRAIALEEELLTRNIEESLTAYVRIADLYIQKEHHDQALDLLRQIAEVDSENIWGWITLATRQVWVNRPEEAIRSLQHAVTLPASSTMDTSYGYYLLFEIYRAEGQVERALAAWHAACIDSTYALASLHEIYRMLMVAKQNDLALRYIEQERNRLRRLFYEALILFRQGKRMEAEHLWRVLLSASPDSHQDGKEAWLLSWIYLGKADHAFEYATQIPKNSLPTFTMLRQMIVTGETTSSVPYLDKFVYQESLQMFQDFNSDS